MNGPQIGLQGMDTPEVDESEKQDWPAKWSEGDIKTRMGLKGKTSLLTGRSVDNSGRSSLERGFDEVLNHILLSIVFLDKRATEAFFKRFMWVICLPKSYSNWKSPCFLMC
jgi:hypothetical protein